MKDYQEYVGKTVLVTQSERTMKFNKEEIVVKSYELSDQDTVIEALRKEVGDLRLRVWLPDTVGTMDFRMDRVNVYVKEQSDGSFKVDRVSIG